MKIIYNKYIPFGNYKAINLFGLIFAKSKLDDESINHEKIHTAQMKEMLYIFFYLWYTIEYLIIFICRFKDSQHNKYRDISLEEEAHNNDKNLDYLNTRKHYTWWKYIKVRSNA